MDTQKLNLMGLNGGILNWIRVMFREDALGSTLWVAYARLTIRRHNIKRESERKKIEHDKHTCSEELKSITVLFCCLWVYSRLTTIIKNRSFLRARQLFLSMRRLMLSWLSTEHIFLETNPLCTLYEPFFFQGKILQCRVAITWCPLSTFEPSIVFFDSSDLERKNRDIMLGWEESESYNSNRSKVYLTARMYRASTTWDIYPPGTE